MSNNPIQIIYLNGASSSGKTTLAKALQQEFDDLFLHIGIDGIIDWMPEKVNNWTGQEAPLGFSWKKSIDPSGDLIYELQIGSYAKKILKSYQEVVITLVKMGHHLIIDDVSFGKKQVDEWKELLKNFAVLWVGVNAPLSVLDQREKERGNRMVGSARGQFHKVHAHATYDLEIDTHHATLEENIKKIKFFVSDGVGKNQEKQTGKISVYIALSIDGYIARKDNSLDWLDRVGGFDEDYGFLQMLSEIDALIIGRKTYEIASTVADPYPGKRVIVLSNSLSSVKAGMELYKGGLRELVKRLFSEGVKHIWVDGGSTISQFLDLQLVDEMALSIIPIVLGDGLPLFHKIGKELPCRLISCQSYPSGLVQHRYEIIKQFNESQDKIYFKVVDYGSYEYKKAVDLREEILRKPLGLFFTKQELEMEKEHVHIAGFLGEEMCAAAALVPNGDEIKMQRVALKAPFQRKGIGSILIRFCQEYAAKHGFKSIYCHARETAVPFYQKNQYVMEGEPFEQVGIPHIKMRKKI